MEQPPQSGASVPKVPLPSFDMYHGTDEHWLISNISQELFLEMCRERDEVLVDDPQGTHGKKINKYYLQAAKYAGLISAGDFKGVNAKYRPTFIIYLKDLNPRLVAELAELYKVDPAPFKRVVKEAIFRLFKARHEIIYYDHIEGDVDFRWRLQY